jgi:hypothetical protein
MIKQHLRIKSFFGTSENAVKSQIWIAISVYVLTALSLTLFEKTSLLQMLTNSVYIDEDHNMTNQLNLFDNPPGQ